MVETIGFFILDKAISLISYLYKGKEDSGKISVSYGNPIVIIGGNTYINCPIIFAENGKPILSVRNKTLKFFKWTWSKILLNFEIYDDSRNILARIEDNEWRVNPNHIFDKKVGRKKIVIYNNKNEKVCDISAKNTGEVVIEGTFYVAGKKIIASEKEIKIGNNCSAMSGCVFRNCSVAININ